MKTSEDYMLTSENHLLTLEDYLEKDAALFPDKVAIICGEESCTYGQLWNRVTDAAASFHSKGQAIPFVASPTIECLVTYFAIHRSGNVAVPLEQESQFSEEMNKAEEADIPAGVADILFTTGTTGKSKGVMISHSTIIANAENLIEAQGFHHDLTFIINGPLSHIGSLSKVYPIILVGGTLHIINGMKDINRFFQAMDSPTEGKFATFLVPASIRMLLTFASDRLTQYADRIEFIETGAAPISQNDMEKLCFVLPQSRLYNTYASTETGIISTYDFQHGECLVGCVGKPMKHAGFIIGEDGKIACTGKTLMSGYYGDEALTRSIMKEGVLYTSDRGTVDKQGRLRLKGRDGDIINVGGYKVAPDEVEDAALSLPFIKDCICIPANHRVLGTILKLLVVLDKDHPFNKREIALALRDKLEPYKIPTQYEQVESIQRTFNGKINRKAYLSGK